MEMVWKILGLCGLLLVAGCTTTSKHSRSLETNSPTPLNIAEKINHALFNKVAIPSASELFSLPDEERTKFIAFQARARRLGVREDKIIFNYLEAKLDEFTYDGQTLTAQESLQENHGNCISLAILTESYAQLANVQTSFTEVSSIPIYQIQNGTVLVANHFKTKLLAPEETPKEKGWISFSKAGTVVDYFPEFDSVFIGNATRTDLITKFYANRSVDALLGEEYDLSYSYLLEALALSPNDAELLNLSALLHKRRGDLVTANTLFEFGFEQNVKSYNLLSNYITLLDPFEDAARIALVESEFEQASTTPIDWLLLAQDYVRKDQLNAAERLLSKVIDAVPYLPEPYIEQAKIHYLRGNLTRARELLATASKKTSQKHKLAIIQAKQTALLRLNVKE